MNIQDRIRVFIGPVKEVHGTYTELEDGGIYISLEQMAALRSTALPRCSALMKSTVETVGAAALSKASVSKASEQLEGLWTKHFGKYDWLGLGLVSKELNEFVFAFGLMWGAYLARSEKR